ncbi:MAG: hypothetical protein GX267_04580 [Fibrobacter sp.]|nr:hypothetical protein [Fibrobacter sp.]
MSTRPRSNMLPRALHDVQTLKQHVTSGFARCADSDATCYINLCTVCRL